jgi:hypothetical protein
VNAPHAEVTLPPADSVRYWKKQASTAFLAHLAALADDDEELTRATYERFTVASRTLRDAGRACAAAALVREGAL